MAIPEKIGRYEVKGELGRGGFATVYRAYDPRFEREVAIKFLPPELIHSDPQFRMRFEREAKIIAQLEHPAIVPVYDVGEENNQPYFVMLYMNGGSLSEQIKAKKKFSIEEAVRIIEQIAPGLDEAHSKGIVHRDLKPANILFTNKGVPLISDFGIAKFSQGEVSGNMTGSAIIGTPAYMAPEQASGDAIDGRADIYALGVILYEMVTGKQPYQADTPLGLAIKHITEPVPRILEANPNLPTWMEKVISTAMAKNRDERFSTAVELVETIKAFLRGERPPERTANITSKISPFNKTATIQKQKPARRSLALAILFGVFALAALIGGGAYFMGEDLLSLIAVAPPPTSTSSGPPADTPTPIIIQWTATPIPPEATATATPESSSGLPVIGGADKIAFVRDNDIWVMNMDGSDRKQFTNDNLPKFNLQWLPDGKTLLYMSGKTVKTVNIETEVQEVIINYISAEYFEGFSVSPDAKKVAISVNRELFIVPYDLIKLRFATRRSALLEMNGCLFNKIPVKDIQWSDDGTRLAIEYVANKDGVHADAIRIVDVQNCEAMADSYSDEFPIGRFEFPDEIVNFDWDGDLLFFLNTNVRNNGFGDMVFYSAFTHRADPAAPYEGNCCYRDASFSPDSSHVIFAFQDIRLGSISPIGLYLIPSDSITTPRELEPLPLPDGFFTERDEAPHPILRPVQP